MNLEYKYIATTFSGLEEVLENELIELGAENTHILTRAVSFEGDRTIMYRANMYCRTALQILVELNTGIVNSSDDIYDLVMDVIWEKYFRPYDSFCVNAIVNQCPFIDNSLYAALKVKDAIVDQLRDTFGVRPSVDKENPNVMVNVHIYRDKFSLYLNTSGLPLFKRGYKVCAVSSPLNEVLAAGMIYLSGWPKNVPLYDPFCGSGTILIEGAMIAMNVAPGLYRDFFAFQKLKSYNRAVFNEIVEEAKSKIIYDAPPIIGSDISDKAVNYANANIKNAGFSDFIKVEQYAFGDCFPEISDGYIITNPPYGVRTDKENLTDLYKLIGDTFKHHFNGFSCWVISSDKDAVDSIGLHASSKRKLFNGPLECRFMGYRMY